MPVIICAVLVTRQAVKTLHSRFSGLGRPMGDAVAQSGRTVGQQLPRAVVTKPVRALRRFDTALIL